MERRRLQLKITDVGFETFQSVFEWSFVRVHAGEEYGTGEAGPIPDLVGCGEAFRPLLVGEDALKVNRIEEKLRHATLYAGTSYQSIASAVNIALHDLIGKHLNVPVWQLIGGDRDEIRVYADAHAGTSFEEIDSVLVPVGEPRAEPGGRKKRRPSTPRAASPILGRLAEERFTEVYTPEAFARRALEMKRAGYSAVKFDLDVPTPFTRAANRRSGEVGLREAAYLGEIAAAVRQAIGEDMELAIDLHWRYDVGSALRICRALEPSRVRWVEDPTPATKSLSNLAELGAITSRTPIPIATGENLRSVAEFIQLLDAGVLVWTPDLVKAGGITEGRRIAELASLYDLEFSPHNISSPVGTMASAHACSLSNTFGYLEFHCHGLDEWPRMARSKAPVVQEGVVRLGEEPGLGLELDEEYVRRRFGHFEL